MHENNKQSIEAGKRRSTSNKICFIISTVTAIGISILAFKCHQALTDEPPFPELDLNSWWGKDGEENQHNTSVRKFRVIFTDAMQSQLIRKFDLHRVRRPAPSFKDSAWNYGINSKALEEVYNFWQFQYSLSQRQRFLNKFEHFKTNIEGLDVHFVHVRPKVQGKVEVVPILLLHGWPGSIREFYELIPLLTTPRAGRDFVFEVIAPSLPGFGYSQAPTKPGLETVQIAIIMRNLMQRLGFTQYYIQGGDFGHIIGSHMATIFSKEVLGFHSNFLVDFSPLPTWKWILGSFWPSLVVEKENESRLYPLKDKVEFHLLESGYMHLQGTKPDTVGAALNDSPVGLAAYILDRFMVFTDPTNRNLTDGGIGKYYDLTGLLDNVMMYWATGSIGTSMRLFKESFRGSDLERALSRIPTRVPTWGLKARNELVYQPDWFLRTKYPNLLGSTNSQEGGHYLAFESPWTVADDVFLAVGWFRDFWANGGRGM